VKLNAKSKVKDIERCSDEISLSLRAHSKPRIKPIYDSGLVRLEFSSPRQSPLNLLDYFSSEKMPGDLSCLLGQSVDGERVWMDLAKNPHMIISGTTGSGKSVLLHNIIANLLNYNKTKIYLIDPKGSEFSNYENRFENIEVGYSYNEAIEALDCFIGSMECRYEYLRKNLDITKLPYAVLIIDEFSDLIMQDKDDLFYNKLCMLAQKCRAARISIILSTQRPSVNVINGTIKANFPARIACKTASQIDSKIVLDYSGAESLLGSGDALLKDNFRHLERFQVAYTTSKEVCEYFEKRNCS
jgi:S-DNA-T family DNA segregation ATPase FtsK/SpoIIIE